MGGVIEPIINNKHPGGVMQKTIFQLAVILLALLESNAADYQFVSASPLLAGPESSCFAIAVDNTQLRFPP